MAMAKDCFAGAYLMVALLERMSRPWPGRVIPHIVVDAMWALNAAEAPGNAYAAALLLCMTHRECACQDIQPSVSAKAIVALSKLFSEAISKDALIPRWPHVDAPRASQPSDASARLGDSAGGVLQKLTTWKQAQEVGALVVSRLLRSWASELAAQQSNQAARAKVRCA
jgi:hypothetical protein